MLFMEMLMRKIFLDCGAHKGESVKKFRQYFDDFEIYSFEANPQLFEHHKSLDTSFYGVLVWDRNCSMPFYLDDLDYDGSSVYSHKRNLYKKSEINAEAIDLSEFIQQHFSKNDLIFLKMDIEGAEYVVLNKMIEDNTIFYVDELLIEFHANKISLDRSVHVNLVKSLVKFNITPHKWDALSKNNDVLKYLFSKYQNYGRD